MTVARGTFEVELAPEPAELDGALARRRLTKTWHGDLIANGTGLMLSGGDPRSGAAGYVAMETVDGRIGERAGSFVFQQFGLMQAGGQSLQYVVVPGSGTGELTGISGTLALTIDADGTHRYEFDYSL